MSLQRRAEILKRSAGEHAEFVLAEREVLGLFGGSMPFASHH